jgi:excisionase family DNA binding protein
VTTPQVEPICVKVNEAARMIGVGRTKLYELIASGEIEAIKLGKSTRITTASLNETGHAAARSGIGSAADVFAAGVRLPR